MVDIMKLRREQKAIKDEMRKMCATALGREDKKLTEEEGRKYAEYELQVQDIDAKIETAERSNHLEMDSAKNNKEEDRATEDEGPKGFASLGEFLQAVRAACTPGMRSDSRLVLEKRGASGMNEEIPSEGGYLVQKDHLAGIIKRVYDVAVLASRCRRIAVGANANGLAWNELKESSRAAGSRWGGIRGYWKGAAGTPDASKPELIEKELKLAKLMALIYTTEEMLQDTTALESFVGSIVSDEFAYLLDEAIFNGTGAGMPLGYLQSPSLVTVSKEAGQVAKTIVYENVLNMRSRLWARSRANSVWFINQDCEPQLQTMAFVIGTGGVPVYLPVGGSAALPYDMMYGRPVLPIEQAKTIGTKGDITLADLSQYLLIDKGGINSAVSVHVRFLYDEQVFRFTYRVNGMPTWATTLTPANGTNTTSPFVALETRS